MKMARVLFSICFCFFDNLVCMEDAIRFRMGFEFQMHGQLCEWALSQKFQKKEVFSSVRSEEKFWHMELDGTDIEFVTEPFDEVEKISNCVSEIVQVVNVLMRLLDNETLQTTISCLFDECVSDGISLMPTQPFFDKVAGFSVKKMSSDWRPKWQPQVTIQHPLKATVNLCWGLFKGCVPNLSRESLPFFMTMSDENPRYNTAIGGLIFLQAHQMAGMAKSSLLSVQERVTMLFSGWDVSKLGGDFLLMAGTLFDYHTYHQFDAKRRTSFMSRRPFSHMFYEIKDTNPEVSLLTDKFSIEYSSRYEDYLALFNEAMKDTEPFLKLQVERSYYRANYAEQFYDDDDNPLNLIELYNYFDKEAKEALVVINGKEFYVVQELLKQGLLSTTMLRHLDLKALVDAGILTSEASQEIQRTRTENYYNIALKSVRIDDDARLERRFLKIEKTDHLHIMLAPSLGILPKIDQLSPPFPLDIDDAIGRYRSGDLRVGEFGGGIVEFRCVEYINDLYDSEHNGKNEFLMDPEYVKNESVALFNKVSSLLTFETK